MIDSKLSSLENHGELGTLLGLLELLLSLAELGQVEGGDLLGLLDLLLVGLDLALELGGELGHAVLVLLVLTLGEGQLLGLALSPLEGLGSLTCAGLGGGQLSFELTDLALELGHGGLASLESSVLSIGQSSLKLTKSVVERVLSAGKSRHMLLLSAE